MTRNKAKEIVEGIIESHFMEIDQKKIKIVFKNRGDAYMYVMPLFFNFYLLAIYDEILNFSEMAFKGCLAHELAHIVDLKQRNLVEKIKFFIQITQPERQADIIAIEKGFGKHLLQFHIEHGRIYKSYKMHEGLTRKEIEKLVKSRK